MRLGLNLGYWTRPQEAADLVALAIEAERLGFAVVWAAEAYGSDAATILAYVAARTERIDIGSAIFQIPGRTPAMTAMTAASLDGLSGGRFRLGLGVSGPQVSEGWHGVPFAHPLPRTREYVAIVRTILRRKPLLHEGKHWTLPLPGGPGKTLKLSMHPLRPAVPVYLAAIGPASLQLTGEIADGWIAVFFAPEHASEHMAQLAAGRSAAGLDMAGFDVVASVPLAVGDDLNACAGPVAAYSALYLGGMGSRSENFYNALARRMGFARAADEVQRLYLSKQHREAAAAVPFELIDQTALIGPRGRLAERLHAYVDAGVTTLAVTPFGATQDERIAALRTIAEAASAADLGR